VTFVPHTQLLTAQVDAVLRDPSELTHTPHPIIYHALLSPTANKGRPLPSRQSLLDEAGILLGAGADSTGVTLMVTAYHILQDPQVRQRLEAELREAWPVLDEVPRYEVLEKLPYLVCAHCPNLFFLQLDHAGMLFFSRFSLTKLPLALSAQAAVTKEGLRMFPGVIAHPRVVPLEGAVISGTFIPGGVRFNFFLHHRRSHPFPSASSPLAPAPLPSSTWKLIFFFLTDDVAMCTRRRLWARVSVTFTGRPSCTSARRHFCPSGGWAHLPRHVTRR